MLEAKSNNSIYKSFELKDENGNQITVAIVSGNYSKTNINLSIDILNAEYVRLNKELLENEIGKFRKELNEKLSELNLLNIL